SSIFRIYRVSTQSKKPDNRSRRELSRTRCLMPRHLAPLGSEENYRGILPSRSRVLSGRNSPRVAKVRLDLRTRSEKTLADPALPRSAGFAKIKSHSFLSNS